MLLSLHKYCYWLCMQIYEPVIWTTVLKINAEQEFQRCKICSWRESLYFEQNLCLSKLSRANRVTETPQTENWNSKASLNQIFLQCWLWKHFYKKKAFGNQDKSFLSEAHDDVNTIHTRLSTPLSLLCNPPSVNPFGSWPDDPRIRLSRGFVSAQNGEKGGKKVKWLSEVNQNFSPWCSALVVWGCSQREDSEIRALDNPREDVGIIWGEMKSSTLKSAF